MVNVNHICLRREHRKPQSPVTGLSLGANSPHLLWSQDQICPNAWGKRDFTQRPKRWMKLYEWCWTSFWTENKMSSDTKKKLYEPSGKVLCWYLLNWRVHTPFDKAASLWDSTFKNELQDFPGGAVVKNPPANAGDTGWSPGPGRSHMRWSN